MKIGHGIAQLRKKVAPPLLRIILQFEDGKIMMDGKTLTPDEAAEAMKLPGAVMIRVVREDDGHVAQDLGH